MLLNIHVILFLISKGVIVVNLHLFRGAAKNKLIEIGSVHHFWLVQHSPQGFREVIEDGAVKMSLQESAVLFQVVNLERPNKTG